jgi:hypothetical protein
VPQLIADPGWFSSSLAQVTAAIVGFLGGFVILRLLDFHEGVERDRGCHRDDRRGLLRQA